MLPQIEQYRIKEDKDNCEDGIHSSPNYTRKRMQDPPMKILEHASLH
jgi:hypothetical protein